MIIKTKSGLKLVDDLFFFLSSDGDEYVLLENNETITISRLDQSPISVKRHNDWAFDIIKEVEDISDNEEDGLELPRYIEINDKVIYYNTIYRVSNVDRVTIRLKTDDGVLYVNDWDLEWCEYRGAWIHDPPKPKKEVESGDTIVCSDANKYTVMFVYSNIPIVKNKETGEIFYCNFWGNAIKSSFLYWDSEEEVWLCQLRISFLVSNK